MLFPERPAEGYSTPSCLTGDFDAIVNGETKMAATNDSIFNFAPDNPFNPIIFSDTV